MNTTNHTMNFKEKSGHGPCHPLLLQYLRVRKIRSWRSMGEQRSQTARPSIDHRKQPSGTPPRKSLATMSIKPQSTGLQTCKTQVTVNTFCCNSVETRSETSDWTDSSKADVLNQIDTHCLITSRSQSSGRPVASTKLLLQAFHGVKICKGHDGPETRQAATEQKCHCTQHEVVKTVLSGSWNCDHPKRSCASREKDCDWARTYEGWSHGEDLCLVCLFTFQECSQLEQAPQSIAPAGVP